MESKLMKRSLVIVLAMAVAMVFSLPYMQTGSAVYGLTKAEQKAVNKAAKKKKNGPFKAAGKWFVAKNKKVAKGYPEVKGKFYWTDKDGVLQSGVIVRDGHTYKYNGKNGAVTNKSLKINGQKLWFSAKGRGNLDVKNGKGNKAVGLVMDTVKFANNAKPRAKMKKCYVAVTKYEGYMASPSPKNRANKAWVGESALKCAEAKSGNCFNKAALVYETALACGLENVTIATGKSNLGSGSKIDTDHCWVKVKDGEKEYFLDAIFEAKGGTKLFFVTPEKKDRKADKCDYIVKAGGKTYKYLQDYEY